jgi:hypothetical protein
VRISPARNILGVVLANDLPGMRVLIKDADAAGLDAAITDSSGHTALHFAAAWPSSISALQLLLSSKLIDPNQSDTVNGMTPLLVACNNGNAEAVSALLSDTRTNPALAKRSNGRSPAHHAAAARSIDCLNLLASAGVNFASTFALDGSSPLTLAAKIGCVDTTRYLLREAGCSACASCMKVATGPAAAYLADTYGAELSLLLDACLPVTVPGPLALALAEPETRSATGTGTASASAAVATGSEHTRAVAVAARSRLLAEIGEFIEPDSVTVGLNVHCDPGLHRLFVAKNAQLRARLGGCPLRLLWHGCDPKILPSVLSEGFKVSYANLTFNVYGAGVYFATDARLSAYFVTHDVRGRKAIPPGPDGCYTLILAAVNLGVTGLREPLCGGSESEKVQMNADLKHPANRNPPVGCDSAAGPFMKETVVYDNTMAFPLAAVSFKLRSGAEIPDPYAADAAARAYLRPLSKVPSIAAANIRAYAAGSQCGGVVVQPDGTRVGIDAEPLRLRADAPLLMGWSTSNRGGSLSHSALLERIAELEQRCVALQSEVELLRSAQLQCHVCGAESASTKSAAPSQ